MTDSVDINDTASVADGTTITDTETPTSPQTPTMAGISASATQDTHSSSSSSATAINEANRSDEPSEKCDGGSTSVSPAPALSTKGAGDSKEDEEQDTGMEVAPSSVDLPSSVGLPSPGGELVPEHPGWVFWRGTLRGARLVVAPMVDASELAWRMLSRRYGAELCFTPMLHSVVLVRDARYRRDNLATCSQDRPLIVQVCANDPAVLAEACRFVSPHCDAIDINLGCPQAIARKGRYGAFLMDDWDLIERLVRSAVASSSVPVTCKIRVYPSHAKTVQYALMLQRAGAALLTVHGRTREQKGPQTGLADWSYVKAVRDAVKVPVFANGNIQYLPDVERCLEATGAQGVMTAEGNLHNPALFADPAHYGPGSSLFAYSAPHATVGDSGPGPAATVWQMALEYLELAVQYPCPISYSRGHLFKLLHHCFSMSEHSDIRQTVSRCNTVQEMTVAVEQLRERMEPYAKGEQPWVPETPGLGALPLPPWLCQPYVRIPPHVHAKRCEEGQRRAQNERDQRLADRLRELPALNGGEAAASASLKRPLEGADEKEADLLLLTGDMPHLSKKKAKKLLRNPRKKFPGPTIENINLCVCRSPRGGKCEHLLCKACCKSRCYRENLDCKGHRIWVRTSRLKATTLPPKPNHDQSEDSSSQTESSRDTVTSSSDTSDLKETVHKTVCDAVLKETREEVIKHLPIPSTTALECSSNGGTAASSSEQENSSEITVTLDQTEHLMR